MFIVALFLITKGGYTPNDYQVMMNIEMWYIQTMKYYTAIKRNEGLTHATASIKFENMLSERSHSQKTIL